MVKLGTLLKTKPKEKHKLKIYNKPKNKRNAILFASPKRFLYSHIARLSISGF
jgi:hypothetical protein